MSSPQETLDLKPSAPPAQAPTPAAEEEQGRLPGGLDPLSCPIPSPASSVPPAAAMAANAQLEDPKPSAPPAAAVAANSQSQLEDPKLLAPPAATVAAGAQIEDPKPLAPPAAKVAAGAQTEDPKPSAAAERPWPRVRLQPVIKLASWPIRRVFHGIGRACDVLVVVSRQPVVVRCVAKISDLVPDRVRGAVSRVLVLFDSLSLASQQLPISDPAQERLYFELDMERACLVVLAVVAAGTVLFITLERLLEAVSNISGFYSNVIWHRAEAARMLQEAAEQKLKVPTPAAKQQLPPPATEQQLPPTAPEQELPPLSPEQQQPPPATEQQLLPPTIELLPPPAAELLIPTPPPPAMDMC